jgi:FkbM family methyltransferase
MEKGFLFRRLCPIIPCELKLAHQAKISLDSKHSIASLQDVYLNPFYWEAMFRINFCPKNVFDLGANYGLFSSLVLQNLFYKGFKEIPSFYLIEANDRLVDYLRKNENELLPNVNVNVLYGAAGPLNNISFENNKHNFLASKITSAIEGNVPFIDFNTLPSPDLLKIDIEGAESLLFKNYFNWLKKAKAIIIEFHYHGDELIAHMNLLKSAHFELILDRDEHSGYKNQLWIKKES